MLTLLVSAISSAQQQKQLRMSAKRKATNSPLEGYCFAITGTLSIGRKEFEQLIQENGGTVAKTVTNKCTHLIRYHLIILS